MTHSPNCQRRTTTDFTEVLGKTKRNSTTWSSRWSDVTVFPYILSEHQQHKLMLQLSFNVESVITALSLCTWHSHNLIVFWWGGFSRPLFFDGGMATSFPLSSRRNVSCFIRISRARQTFSIRGGRWLHCKQVQRKLNKKKQKKKKRKKSVSASKLEE